MSPLAIPVISDSRVYLGSKGLLTCVGDGQKPLAALQTEVAKGEKLAAAVRLVELSLRMGKPDVAIAAIYRAVRQGATDPQKAGIETMHRLFNICLTFGRQYARKVGPDNERIAQQLLGVAGQCATDSRERILSHASTADLRMTSKKSSEAVAALQAILLDDALRVAALPDDLGSPDITAGQWAQMRIDSIITRHGRAAYATFDLDAARMLQSAEKSNDVKRFQALVARYPNSQSVPKAWAAIGRIVLARGDAKAAIEPLRKAALQANSGSTIQMQAMIGLLQAYEKLGSNEAAAVWVTRLASVSPRAAFEIQGKAWTAARYAAILAEHLCVTPSAVHRLDLPLRASFERTEKDAISLIRGNATFSTEHVLASSAGSVQAYDARRGRPCWRQPVAFKSAPELVAGDTTQIVLHDRYRAVCCRSGIRPDAMDVVCGRAGHRVAGCRSGVGSDDQASGGNAQGDTRLHGRQEGNVSG